MELEKGPVPMPSEVIEFVIVGFELVLQQTPRAVIAPPPFEIILPPDVAVVEVIPEIAFVVNDGKPIDVVKITFAPYTVPSELVQYARTLYVVPAINPVIELV